LTGDVPGFHYGDISTDTYALNLAEQLNDDTRVCYGNVKHLLLGDLIIGPINPGNPVELILNTNEAGDPKFHFEATNPSIPECAP